MILLMSFIASGLFLVLGIALYIDGRREVPSIWIRNEVLFAVAANADVALLIFGVGGLIATLIDWIEHGIHVQYPWGIAATVAATLLLVKMLLPKLRLVNTAALARAAEATLPTPGDGPLPG